MWLFRSCSAVNNWLNIVVWFVILWISDCFIVALLNNWLKSVPLDERLHWTNIRYGWSTIEQPHGSFLCRNLYLWYIYTSQAKLGSFVHILWIRNTRRHKYPNGRPNASFKLHTVWYIHLFNIWICNFTKKEVLLTLKGPYLIFGDIGVFPFSRLLCAPSRGTFVHRALCTKVPIG